MDGDGFEQMPHTEEVHAERREWIPVGIGHERQRCEVYHRIRLGPADRSHHGSRIGDLDLAIHADRCMPVSDQSREQPPTNEALGAGHQNAQARHPAHTSVRRQQTA